MDVKIHFDHEYRVEDTTDIGTIKILMLKGEKGEGGTPTQAQVDSAVADWLDEHPEATTTVQDGSITEQKLDPLLTAKVNGGGISNAVKVALLALLEKVAYVDEDGQTYLDALEDALYPPTNLVSITAVFTQGSATIYDIDSLDTLKQYLVVTANYDDSSTATVTTYTLSGTLTEGTSTITVSYGGKTTTFDVTVTSGSLAGYITVGNPTITDGILSVTDGNFVKTPEVFSPGSSPWRITCKYRNTSGAYARYTDILGSVNDSNASYRSLLLELTNNTGSALAMYLSSNGTSWNIGSGTNTETTALPRGKNVWVWLDFSYTGSAYELRYSTNGETFTLGKSHSSTEHIVDGYAVGFGLKRNGVLQGEIDLNECKIYIGDRLWWKAIA